MPEPLTIAPATGRLGILTPGMGAVASTAYAGVLAARAGLAAPIGSLTQMAHIRLGSREEGRNPMIKDFVPLAGLDDLVFGGWDPISANALEAARTAGVLDEADLAPVIDALVKLKCYEAIDPLVEIASQTDPVIYAPALEGLRGIADPDKTDIPRLVKLLLKTEPGKHRDEVEKTILIVCDKLPADADRSELVLAALAQSEKSEASTYLPLLGRLGGGKAREMIETSLKSEDAAVREAALRALCNWPDAGVADKLLDLAKNAEDRADRVRALRAYIRVVTLPSQRPESETLAMLQNAMKLAEGADEKRLAIQRASTVRTMEAVAWLAQYLDDPELSQAACLSIVELAHHRFLRHPNMDRFGPILDKVGRVSKDPDVAQRAKRYRLGL